MSDMLPEVLGGPGGMLALGLLTKAALILGAAWLLERLSVRGSAAVRHGIWATALTGVVALPLAGHWLPPLSIDLELPRFASYFDAAPAQPAAGATSRNAAAAPPERASSLSLPEARTSGAPAGAAEPLRDPPPEGGGIGWLAMFMVVWAGGALLRLVWLALQFKRVRWMSGHAGVESDSPAVRIAEQLARQLGIRRSICVLESSWASMPLTWGVLRPVVLLPREASDWPEERLRVVLLHELGHIRRWDYLLYLVAEVACALYWPLPLVWLGRAHLQKEQEQACDDLVLASGTTAVEYAEHLLAVARAFYGNRWELGATVTMAREVSLKNRIRTILDARIDRRPLLSGSGLLILLLLSGFTLPVAAIRPGAEEVDAGASAAAPRDIAPVDEATALPTSTVEIAEAAAAVASTWLWLEAEDGRAEGPMELREDLGASSGGHVVVPDGGGNDAPEGGSGQVSFTFVVPASGEYLVWGRALGAHDNDNSFYVSIDGGQEIRWDIEDQEGDLLRDWEWVPIRDETADRPGGGPMRFGLAAGAHTLRIRNREDGTLLDRLLVTGDTTYRPAGRGADGPGYRPTYRWMEVEQASLHGSIRHARDERASGGQSIAFHRASDSGPSGIAAFAFDVEAPGRYVVWGRVLAPDGGANSFYASLDGGAEVIWDAPEGNLGRRAGRWSWSPLNAREYNGRRVDPLLLDLQPGRHVLRLRTREPGIRLDGVLVTNDIAFRPRGIWPSALPTRPVRIWLEAETALLDAPLLVRSDPAAAGGLYVQVEERTDRRNAPGAEATGSAVLRFTVPQAGLYNLWARTRAHHGGENSFWVRVNGGEWIRWNEFPTGSSWSWSMVHDEDRGSEVAQVELQPGENTVEFAAREGGARIDRVLVTNDPLAAPDELND